MSNIDYKNLFAIQKKLEKVILKACPTMPTTSGIYFYTRIDEDGKYIYIGKAVNLLRRSISHLQGYQHIDISLKKRGFYSEDNKNGWHLNYLIFPEHLLDEKEAYYIKQYQDAGYHLYNIESGGTLGKTIINEKKPIKTYKDGLKQGYKNAQRDVAKLFEKNLVYTINGKPNKLKEKALEKFKHFLGDGNGMCETDDGESKN